MKLNAAYPYSLKKKGDIIKLEIKPKRTYDLLSVIYITATILFTFSTGLCGFFLFVDTGSTLIGYIIHISILILCILFSFLAFYMFRWKRSGIEIFELYPNKLESTIRIEPFKTEKHIHSFKKLEIGYQSGEDFYSEEEAELLGVELDLDKVEGNYPIQFYMDEGEQIIDSDRKIPIRIIRKVRDEYLLIKNDITNGL